MRRAVWVSGAVALLLALVGCTPSPPPRGLTGEELADYRLSLAENAWHSFALGDRERPAVEFERFVSLSEWGQELVGCLTEEGVDAYLVDGRAIGWSSDGETDAGVGLGYYTCAVRFPLKPEAVGFYSREQREYLYDYYGRVLMPCLAAEGVQVLHAPSRESFVSGVSDQWSPYQAADPATREPERFAELDAVCPASPFDRALGVAP